MQTGVRKKMLYIMGIDWNWIRQRPQILAEYLSLDYDITVVYPVKIWSRPAVRSAKEQEHVIRYLRLWTIPFQRKIRMIGRAADWYIRRRLRICSQYDYIYLGYPTYVKYIPADYKGCLIYDCMDDHAQMCGNETVRREIVETEKRAVCRSSLLLASSVRLLRKVESQSGGKPVRLIRNGTGFDRVYRARESQVRKQYTVGYIGTIAEWFDHDLLLKSVSEHPELSYHLIGPHMGIKQPENSRISYDGIMEHTALRSYIEDYDCLIMPFIVNEIVRAVDPVKLYDYIAFGKCIVSVWYEELEYFKEYVYFYSTYEEYDRLMRELIRSGFPPKYNGRQQKDFLRENGWEERYRLLREAIRQAEEERQFTNEDNEYIRNQTGSDQDVSAGERTGSKSGDRKRRMPDGAASGNA